MFRIAGEIEKATWGHSSKQQPKIIWQAFSHNFVSIQEVSGLGGQNAHESSYLVKNAEH